MLNLSIIMLTSVCSLPSSTDAHVRFTSPDEASAAGITAVSEENGSSARNNSRAEGQSRAGGPDADALISVARDVSIEWAKTLESARAKGPEVFRAAAAKLGKRLSSLAVLREHKPALYALRVEELKVQGQLDGLGPQWISARMGNRAEEAAQLEAQIRGLAGTLVDLNLRSRAMELAEIDAVMRTMRADLQRDASDRNETVERMVVAVREGTGELILGGRSPVDTSASTASKAVTPAKTPAPAATGPAATAPAVPAPASP
jgi:hypothetical protein